MGHMIIHAGPRLFIVNFVVEQFFEWRGDVEVIQSSKPIGHESRPLKINLDGVPYFHGEVVRGLTTILPDKASITIVGIGEPRPMGLPDWIMPNMIPTPPAPDDES